MLVRNGLEGGRAWQQWFEISPAVSRYRPPRFSFPPPTSLITIRRNWTVRWGWTVWLQAWALGSLERRRERWQLIGRRWRLVRHSGEGSTLSLSFKPKCSSPSNGCHWCDYPGTPGSLQSTLPLPPYFSNYHNTDIQKWLCSYSLPQKTSG